MAAMVSGDFNGDGVADVALGAANADGSKGQSPDSGEVMIFLGPFVPREVYPADMAAVTLLGRTQGENFGRTLAVGDFDGDDTDDLAIAAPLFDGSTGRIEVMLGGSDLGSGHNTTILGIDPGDYAGLTMGVLHDSGGDSLIIGALEAAGPENGRERGGEAYVIAGSELTATPRIDLATVQDVIYGAEAHDRLGEALTTGDVNGDGAEDLVVVAPFASGPDNARESAGETYVFFSPFELPLDLAIDAPDITIIGTDAGDQLGHAIAVGDRDGDGADDIMLGAVSADGYENGVDLAGEVVLVDGTSRGVVDTANATLPTVYGPEKEARLGRYAAAGDLNADGLADLVVSAPNLAVRAGRVYVFYGGDSFPESVGGADLTLRGFDPGDVLGTEVFGTPPFSVVDIDGDGVGELLIAAPQADGPDNLSTDAGDAYIVFLED